MDNEALNADKIRKALAAIREHIKEARLLLTCAESSVEELERKLSMAHNGEHEYGDQAAPQYPMKDEG
jgi:hypothetical protein